LERRRESDCLRALYVFGYGGVCSRRNPCNQGKMELTKRWGLHAFASQIKNECPVKKRIKTKIKGKEKGKKTRL